MTNETNQETAPQVIELSELPAGAVPGASVLKGNLGLVQNVRATLTVVAGATTVTIGELLSMKAEHVLKLDRLVDEPLDLLLDGQVVARGQLVAVDDNFGVRIIEVPGVDKP